MANRDSISTTVEHARVLEIIGRKRSLELIVKNLRGLRKNIKITPIGRPSRYKSLERIREIMLNQDIALTYESKDINRSSSISYSIEVLSGKYAGMIYKNLVFKNCS